jgi:hypothetical protein
MVEYAQSWMQVARIVTTKRMSEPFGQFSLITRPSRRIPLELAPMNIVSRAHLTFSQPCAPQDSG